MRSLLVTVNGTLPTSGALLMQEALLDLIDDVNPTRSLLCEARMVVERNIKQYAWLISLTMLYVIQLSQSEGRNPQS